MTPVADEIAEPRATGIGKLALHLTNWNTCKSRILEMTLLAKVQVSCAYRYEWSRAAPTLPGMPQGDEGNGNRLLPLMQALLYH